MFVFQTTRDWRLCRIYFVDKGLEYANMSAPLPPCICGTLANRKIWVYLTAINTKKICHDCPVCFLEYDSGNGQILLYPANFTCCRFAHATLLFGINWFRKTPCKNAHPSQR